ncbi:MAG TPA: EutN/CcmL family microcompartment protein [Bdellovibrionales bacterium]|nr:EutN/CcmL family microcompartment protein [Bdellovibrionales bacterium]
MFLGRVLGTVVATKKADGLLGQRLYVFEPLDDEFKSIGEPMVAVDTVGSREGDVVMWVASREASLALDNWFVPVDAAIVGIVDDCNGRTT